MLSNYGSFIDHWIIPGTGFGLIRNSCDWERELMVNSRLVKDFWKCALSMSRVDTCCATCWTGLLWSTICSRSSKITSKMLAVFYQFLLIFMRMKSYLLSHLLINCYDIVNQTNLLRNILSKTMTNVLAWYAIQFTMGLYNFQQFKTDMNDDLICFFCIWKQKPYDDRLINVLSLWSEILLNWSFVTFSFLLVERLPR